jgi:two-component system sensor histidine kinase UhpB
VTPLLYKSSYRSGVTLQLFLLVVLPLTGLLFAVTFGSISLHNQAMRSLVGDRDLRTVQAAASSLGQGFFHQKASIQMLAEASRSGSNFQEEVRSNPTAFSNFDEGVGLFSSDGQLIASNQDLSSWPGRLSGQERSTWQDFLQKSGSQAQFSPVFAGGVTDPFLAFVAAPTGSGDGKLVVGAYRPDAIVQATLKDMLGGGQITAWVATPQGQVIYRVGSLASKENLPSHPGTSNALGGESGINYTQTNQGEHVVAFSPIPSVGWALVLEEPWEAIASPMLQTTQIAPLVLVPVVLLMVLTLWFGLHQIVQPLKALEARADEMAQGDFASIQKPVGGVPEIQNLQSRLVEMAKEVEAAQDSLHNYIGAITAGVENERRSLARELHDDTLQALIALNQRLQLASLNLNNAPEQTSLEDVEKLVQQTMVNLRRMVRGLRPIYLEDLGLVASLEMLAGETQQTNPISVQTQVSGVECRQAPDVEMALYRMAQEALSNIVRHAQASHAWLDLEYADHSIELTVRDDGQGFTPPATVREYARKGHYGLLGLYERSELIGARLTISSQVGEGTRITIRLDLPGQTQA